MRIMIKISRKILLMKKRILSLFLALAMVATAAVVPGTSAEAAVSGGWSIDGVNSGTGVKSGNFNDYISVVGENGARAGWSSATVLKIGDKLTYKAKDGKAGEVSLINSAGRRVDADVSTSDLHVVWVKREKATTDVDDWTVAGDLDDNGNLTEYVVTREDIGYQFAVLVYLGFDKGDTIIVSGAANGSGTSVADAVGPTTIVGGFTDLDDILSAFVTSSALGADARSYGWMINNDKVIGFLSDISGSTAVGVEHGNPTKDMFELNTAKVNGKAIKQIGTTLYYKNGDSEGKAPELTFKVVGQNTGDVLDREDKAGTSNDPLYWARQRISANDGKISGSALDARAYTGDNQLVGDNNFPTARIYLGGSTNTKAGKYYDIKNVSLKTDYTINIISAAAAQPTAVLYLGDMNEGETVEQLTATGLNKDAQNLAYFATSTFSLPKYAEKKDKNGKIVAYLQGWSATSNTGAMVVRTANIEIASDVVYYAVWGDKMPDVNKTGVEVYRAYNPNSGEHLYTSDVNEYNSLVASGWNGEGVKLYGDGTGAISSQPNVDTGRFAVRRMYNHNTGEHMYVQDASNEMNTLARLGWTIEANIFTSVAVGNPVYRLWNGVDGVGSHLWTMDTNEVNVLRTQYGWRYEGTPFNSIAQ